MIRTFSREFLHERECEDVHLLRFFFPATLAVLLSTVSLGWGAGLNQQIQRQKSELEALKKTLAVEKKALDSLVKRRTGLVQEMEQLNENLELTESYLAKMDSLSESIRLSLQEIKFRIGNLQSEIEGANRMMARRMRSLYLSGSLDFFSIIVEAGAEGDFFQRVFFVKKLLAYDKALVSRAQTIRSQEREAEKELQVRLRENLAFKERKAREMAGLSKERRALKSRYEALQQNEFRKRQALQKMEENSKALAAILKKLERQRKKEAEKKEVPRKLDDRGKYCFPSEGERISSFGVRYHKTLKTKTKNLGVEYLGRLGEAVRSAGPGEVVYVNAIPGYGRGLIIYNGSGYYTIYGNLSNIRVKEGEKVAGCQELAVVPSIGGRLSRKIYFEVRKERESIDPVNWLKSMID